MNKFLASLAALLCAVGFVEAKSASSTSDTAKSVSSPIDTAKSASSTMDTAKSVSSPIDTAKSASSTMDTAKNESSK